MSASDDLPPSYTTVPRATTATTVYDDRTVTTLAKVNLSPPERIPLLPRPQLVDLRVDAEAVNEARWLLVNQRVQGPGYRKPEDTLKFKLWPPGRKETSANTEAWAFTKHEVARAFDSLFSRESLPRPAVAQALLFHAPGTSIDQLWNHLKDPKLEKKPNLLRRKSLTLNTVVLSSLATADADHVEWLDRAAGQQNAEYVHLMCQTGLSEGVRGAVLCKAFRTALYLQSFPVMETLLQHGATTDRYATICDQIKMGNEPLARLLLSAPHAMTSQIWEYCIQACIGDSARISDIVLLCVAHRPEAIGSNLLLQALQAQDIHATAILLAFSEAEKLVSIHENACNLVWRVQDATLRYQFYVLLAHCGLVVDIDVVRRELYKAVRSRNLPLIKLFVDARITVDADRNAFRRAVSKLDLEVLGLMRAAKFSSPASSTLDSIPESASEEDVLQFVDMFGFRCFAGENLHSLLIKAITKGHRQLVGRLLHYEASIEYSDGSPIKAALAKADLGTLTVLLERPCSPKVLTSTFPFALAIKPRPLRLQATQALLGKCAIGQDLGGALQTLLSMDGDETIDAELVQLMLKHQAPVDGTGSLAIAARRGDKKVLKMLCERGPTLDTLSRALPVAFETITAHGYQVAYEMIDLLLDKGAQGRSVDETLVLAALHDSRLDMVQLLLKHGADANYEQGASYAVALKPCNYKLLEMLCVNSKPSRATLESVLFAATDAKNYNHDALQLLLESTQDAAGALNAAWSSDKFSANPNLTPIVACFLRHGLDVNLHNGALLCLAVKLVNHNLLAKIVSAGPSVESLSNAFKIAKEVLSSHFAVVFMSLLLEKAKSVEIGQSEALLSVTLDAAITGKESLLRLLLNHKASVNFQRGEVVVATARQGSTEVLSLLLKSSPSVTTIRRACLTIAGAYDESKNHEAILELLLTANGGLSAKKMNSLLATSVFRIPEHVQLPKLLLERGTVVTHDIFMFAVNTSSEELFRTIFDAMPQSNTMATTTFKQTVKLSITPERRYLVYRHLLSSSIPTTELSEALIESLKGDLGDLSVQKLLLQRGATVDYRKGEAFSLALQSSFNAFRLLSQHIKDDRTASLAFYHTQTVKFPDAETRVGIYRALSPWNLDSASVDYALHRCLQLRQTNEPLLRFLLQKGANASLRDGECFALAYKARAEPEFRVLSKYARAEVVLKALLHYCSEEWEVCRWFSMCLEELPHTTTLEDDDLLFECIEKFPLGSELVRLVLDRGLSTSTQMDVSLYPDWEAEPCSSLIFALIRSPRGENDVALAILSRCNSELPTYKTPTSNVCAASICVLDKRRLPVLEKLMELDGEQVSNATIQGPVFSHLAAHPNALTSSEEVSDELKMWAAALYAGNLEAFCLLGGGESPDDTTLHIAAYLALPKFVEHLLHTHHPDQKSENMGNLIPLALACRAQFNPWCKAANKEADWEVRQEATIRVLAKETDCRWKKGGKTVLHFALLQGVRVAKIMIEALEVRDDEEKDERYLYCDKDGVFYSPHQWVRCSDQIPQDTKSKLIALLNDCGMKTRYFKKVMPGSGKQPPGYHGLPSDYESAWSAESW